MCVCVWRVVLGETGGMMGCRALRTNPAVSFQLGKEAQK